MNNNRRRFCAAVLGVLMTVQNTALGVSAIDTETDNAPQPQLTGPKVVESVSEYGLKTIKYYDENGQEILPDYATKKSFAAVTDSYYNAAEEGRVTSVKDQNPYGTCWAFTSLSCAETSLIDKGIEDINVDFSERHLVWFTTGTSYSASDPLYGGDFNVGSECWNYGGNPYYAISTLSSGVGPAYESDAPYKPEAVSESLRYNSAGLLTEAEFYDVDQRNVVKKAILDHGSVFCGFNIDQYYYYNSSTYGYYSPYILNHGGHAVTVVGWDDNYSRYNFNHDPGEDGAWIVKNSYGSDWGDNGYFYISYNDATISVFASFEMSGADTYDNIYQYDAYKTYERRLGFSGYGSAVGNMFTAEETEDLTAVGFMTADADTDYIIRIYTDVTDDPTDGTLVHSQSGVADFAGYHTVDLTKAVALDEGTDFSVVVISAKEDACMSFDGGSTVSGRSFFAPYNVSSSTLYAWNDAYNLEYTDYYYDDEGNRYEVEISDPVDAVVKAYTNSVEEIVEISITGQPSDSYVSVGDTAIFSTSAEGRGLTYLWQYSKDGGVSWSNTSCKSSIYFIDNVKAYYNGYKYRCKITDSSGDSITTNAATLYVSEALSITSQPEDVTVNAGEPASFSVTATGSGLSYLWQVSKNGGATWTNTSTKTSAYTLSSAKSSYNGYRYRCIVTDANGNSITSNSATLVVSSAAALSITSQPASVTVNEGSSAKFTVKASGTGLTYLWQVSKNNGVTWTNTSSKTATYSLGSAKASYNGYRYRCIVTDAYGNSVTSNAATLTVAASLSITSQPANVTANVGSPVSFTVKASGTGLTYLWQVSKNSGVTWSNTSTRTATYTLGSAKAAYSGYKYRCIVTDAYGNSVTSNAATLTVAASLTITSQPANVTTTPGSSASFTVKASGTGLTYLWQFSKNGGSTWSNTSTRTAAYTLSSVKTTYNGYKYRCIVTDAYGNSVTSNAATLTVSSSAITITAQPTDVTVSTGSSATFYVRASGTGLTYQWQVSKNNGVSWSNTSCKTNTYTLSSVRSYYSGYMYRCVITDSNGNTVTSSAAALTVN